MRLFVAVEIPEVVRTAVAEAVGPLRACSPRLRWVDPQRYHLTVAFLGEVAQERVGAVSAALAEAAAGVAPFELALTGEMGRFGRRVLWAGVEASAPLAQLARAVRTALVTVVDLPDGDRPFSAHLTLARSGRDPVRRDLAAGRVPALRWRVGRVVLMQSAGGYRVVDSVDLRDEDA